MSEPELKPCPFCGGKAEVYVGQHMIVDAEVICTVCSASGPIVGTEDDATKDGSIKQAVEHWNTRVGEDVERERANIANNAAEYMYQIALRGGATIPRDVFVSVLAHLVAAHSLLKGGGKKAAASDTIFGIMLTDMQEAIDAGRNVIRAKERETRHGG